METCNTPLLESSANHSFWNLTKWRWFFATAKGIRRTQIAFSGDCIYNNCCMNESKNLLFRRWCKNNKTNLFATTVKTKRKSNYYRTRRRTTTTTIDSRRLKSRIDVFHRIFYLGPLNWTLYEQNYGFNQYIDFEGFWTIANYLRNLLQTHWATCWGQLVFCTAQRDARDADTKN